MPPAPADSSELDVPQRELRLLMEIDQVRDSAKDPATMLTSLLLSLSAATPAPGLFD